MSGGLTLVELAIVIVIVGLIVGGVVGGQSLIESAKMQAVVKEITEFKNAIRAFKLEYDALPGDMRDATDYWGQAGDGSYSQCLTVPGNGTETCNGDVIKLLILLIQIQMIQRMNLGELGNI